MKIVVENLAVEYQDSGSGPVLLFLHGWKDTLHTFDSLIASLPKKWRVIALDMPGFGKTETPAQAWDLDNYVNWTRAFIKKMDISPYCIVGHSFGGRVAIKGIGAGNLSAEKMILIGGAGISKQKSLRNRLVTFVAKAGKYLTILPPFILWRRKIKTALYSKIGSDYLGAGSLKETYLKIIKEDVRNYAEKITIPTLLIWGAEDSQTPVTDGRIFEGLISDSILKVIPETGHFVHQENPQLVATYIGEFL